MNNRLDSVPVFWKLTVTYREAKAQHNEGCNPVIAVFLLYIHTGMCLSLQGKGGREEESRRNREGEHKEETGKGWETAWKMKLLFHITVVSW